MKVESPKLRCSFCGKDEGQVKKLVAGASAVICDECVAKAARIVNSPADDTNTPPNGNMRVT